MADPEEVVEDLEQEEVYEEPPAEDEYEEEEEGLDIDELEGLDKEEEEGPGDDKKKVAEDWNQKVAAAEKKYNDLQIALRQENKALHDIRQAKKGEKAGDDDGTPALTDEQLDALMEKHQDDPVMMRRLVSYIAEEAAKKGAKETVDAAEISRQKEEIDSQMNVMYPWLSDDTDEHTRDVRSTMKTLSLGNHPYGQFLALSAMIHRSLDDIKEEEYRRGLGDATKKGAEVNRRRTVKESSLTPDLKTGKGVKTPLPASVKETARLLGFNKRQSKIYEQLLKKPGGMEE